MKNVVIIDDEPHIRSLLKYLIHWDELDLMLKGCFDNAFDAVTLMGEEKIDIVITDIMMPQMTGLEFIERAKEINKDCRFIIISGFQDFEFAQSAVKLGVSDYILKPINEDELNNILKKLAMEKSRNEERDETVAIMRQKFVIAMQGKVAECEREKINKEFAMNFADSGNYYVILLGVCNYNKGEDFRGYIDHILSVLEKSVAEFCIEQERFMLSDLRYAIVVQIKPGADKQVFGTIDRKYRELVQQYAEITKLRFYLSVGIRVESVGLLRESLESAEFFLEGRLVYKSSRVYIANILPQAEALLEENIRMDPEQVRQFKNAVDAVDVERVKKVIRDLFDDFPEDEEEKIIKCFYLPAQLVNCLKMVLEQRDVHHRDTEKLAGELKRILENCDSIFKIRSETESFCVEKMIEYLGIRKSNVQVYVQCAKEYIDIHYREDVTLNVIAEQIHVNPAYLSNIFKETMGVNYSVYLTSKRMEKAKELLENVNLNLSQIADYVGYKSTRYFSRIFERETGMKPSDYRRIHLRSIKN